MPNYYSDGTHSDAAIDYYNQHKDATWCCPTIRAFDAGHAAALATAAPAPQPERLTDPDDPRIKPGARVQYVTDLSVVDGIWNNGVSTSPSFIRRWITGKTARVYLLAQAPTPDPDADVRQVITKTIDGGYVLSPELIAAGVVDSLRAAGYDVVKRES